MDYFELRRAAEPYLYGLPKLPKLPSEMRRFNPLQPRDLHGRWRGVSAQGLEHALKNADVHVPNAEEIASNAHRIAETKGISLKDAILWINDNWTTGNRPKAKLTPQDVEDILDVAEEFDPHEFE